MSWLRNNIVGLVSLLLIMGGSLVTLYVKAEVNKGAIITLQDTTKMLLNNQSKQSIALQEYAMRTSQLEGHIERFSKSNDRLVLVLDKLDVVYSSLKVTDAIQAEKIKQLVEKIDKVEKEINGE